MSHKIGPSSARYEQDCLAGRIHRDFAQQQVIEALDMLYQSLKKKAGRVGRFSHCPVERLKKFLCRNVTPRGLYLWGEVGRGKSYLMGLFFDSLDFLEDSEKQRIHFNRFMKAVHANLKACQGEKDPLKIVAKQMAKTLKVLCFDEFFVEDIADAMILGKLFEYLFQEGICLVATSNRKPEDLYPEGLKREQFLPAIARIQENTWVLEISPGKDYREVQNFDHKKRYLCPTGDQMNFLTRHFEYLKTQAQETDLPLNFKICGREVQAIRRSQTILWMDFSELCTSPRSQMDYIELANQYRAILLSNAPVLTPDKDDQARRFIALMDEIYDRQIELFVAAEAWPEDLYQGTRHRFAFKRAESRLRSLMD